MPVTDLDRVLHDHPEAQFRALRDKALSAIADQFPIDGRLRTLSLDRVWVDEQHLDPEDLAALKKAKLAGRSWTVPIYASLTMREKRTGKTLEHSRRVLLGHLPRPTPNYSFLVDGTEYQLGSQPRLKPGVYARRKANGQLEGFVNLAKGRNFALQLDPDTARLSLEVGASHIPLYPVLKALGTDDGDLEAAWGRQVLEANRLDGEKQDKELGRLVRLVGKGDPPADPRALRQVIGQIYADTELDPEVTQRTLGERHSRVTPGLLAATAGKLLKLSRGEAEPDDRDGLAFQQFFGPEDLLDYNLRHWRTRGAIRNRIAARLDAADSARDAVGRTIGQTVRRFFTQSSQAAAAEQNNPLDMISQFNRVDSLGEGGISSARAVPDESRDLNDSYMGYLDPLHTPESQRIGVTLHTALGTSKAGRKLRARLVDAKTGREVLVSPEELADRVVAFPGQFRLGGARPTPPSQRVKVMARGRMDEVPARQVDYVLPAAHSLFDLSTNLIPFLGSTQGTRGMTAAKMLEQALPLVGREAPDVQVEFSPGQSFEDLVGERFSVRAPADGRIDHVGPDHLVLAARNGRRLRLALHDHYPLNQKTFLHHEPLVKPGDRVRSGQVLADSNFTRHGTLALGRGLTVAYLPWKGYTLEDASVISESAAKKLTSLHLHHRDVPLDDASVLDLAKHTAYYPERVAPANRQKLDGQGVVKPGQRVEPGEVLVAHLRREEAAPEDTVLARLHKSLVKPLKDRSVAWDQDFEGVVTDVVHLGNRVRVYVRTEEPARVGDKVAGRYGNKSVISKVLPDAQMPRTGDGTPVDLLFDPHTVPSRINPSQILESAAGQAAHRLGRRYLTRNFEPGSALTRVQELMRQAGLPESGKQDLVDPDSGRTIPGIFVGRQHIQKLKHQVEQKFAARSYEPGYDIHEAPRGGRFGAQSLDHLTLYSMLAHGGSRELLREMATDYKASRNPELWRALQLGQQLPAPRPTFAFSKFLGYLQGLGVHVRKDHEGFAVQPLTDDGVEEISRGQIPDPTAMVRGKDLRPTPGGLFDPAVTGGLRGQEWSHLELARRIPHPLLARGVQVVTGITGTQYDDLLAGRLGVDGDGRLVPVG